MQHPFGGIDESISSLGLGNVRFCGVDAVVDKICITYSRFSGPAETRVTLQPRKAYCTWGSTWGSVVVQEVLVNILHLLITGAHAQATAETCFFNLI